MPAFINNRSHKRRVGARQLGQNALILGSGNQGAKFVHGVPAQPVVDLMPLDGPMVVHGPPQQPRGVFRRELMVGFHDALKIITVKRADGIVNLADPERLFPALSA